MSQVISIVILVCLCHNNVFSLQCADKMVGDCQCMYDKRATYQFHCPSYDPDKKKLDVLVKSGTFAQVSCPKRNVTSEEIFKYLNQLQLGLIKTLKFRGCPLPRKSYQQTMTEMGVYGVQRLWIDAASGQNSDSNLWKNLTVRALDLAYFNNMDIDKDLFKNSTLIEHLSVNKVARLTLHKDSFENLPLLNHLNLHSCGINSLDKEIFKNMTRIKELSLHGNKLEELPDGIFDNLRNLTKINLGSNQLKTLPNNVFQFNDQIQETILSYNCFESLPENLFAGKQKLDIFDFRPYNPRRSTCSSKLTALKLPESMFQNSSIREIKFLHINVESIPKNYLRGCKDLRIIVIQSGNIGTIPNELFQDTPSIEKIDFVNNKINDIFAGTFKGLKQLATLRLMYNNISALDPELFADVKNLKTLHLSYNNIDDIHDDLFDRINKIEEVDLSRNVFRKVPDVFLQRFGSLKKLKMSHNLITSFNIETLSNLTRLSSLDLSANNISGYLEMKETVPTKTNVIINFSRNKLKGVLLSKNTMKINNVKLLLSGNPLLCDCFATEVKELNMEHFLKKNVIVDQKDFLCDNRKNLQQTPFSELTCPFPSERLNESCPINCTCKLNRYSQQISVFCSGQSLTQIPPNLPSIPGESGGVVLHLENNLLSNLTEALQKSYEANVSNTDKISELHLSGNKLRYVSEKYMPRNLEYLAVDDNNIHHFSNSTIQYFRTKVESSNFSLKLGNNPYDCNCNSLELLHFLKMFYSHIEDYQTLATKCLDESKEILTLNEEDFCPPKSPMISVLVPVVVLLIGMFIFILLHIFYKETIKIYIFSKSWGKFFFSEDHMDQNKPYDAFISYSHHDSEFAEMKLLPGLESEENPKEHQYKCLIHTRDWNVGQMISDQIFESVDRSRRTIIVLSEGYIQSMWSKLEFSVAHKKAMKENTQRVIIILHGDKLATTELDEDLQKYISSNTYIDSKDPWFWRKLRYALPKKSRKPKEKTKKVHDKFKDKGDHDNSEKDHYHDSSSQDKISLPYHTQLSREMLLPSVSLKLHLDDTEYTV